jgi:hypothetical protein
MGVNAQKSSDAVVFSRYGTDVAAVTDAAFATAGNSYLTFYNTAALGPKGIAKRMAKVCIQGVGWPSTTLAWPGCWKQPDIAVKGGQAQLEISRFKKGCVNCVVLHFPSTEFGVAELSCTELFIREFPFLKGLSAGGE